MTLSQRLPERVPFVGGDGEPVGPFIERAARWATDLEYRDVPRPVREAASVQLASTVGAAVWTTTHPVGRGITEAVGVEATEEGTATFLGATARAPAVAAGGNAALSMALDFDDTILGGHTGHSSVFVPLAYAEATGASGERTHTAQVAANEVAARLASAAAIGPFRGQQTAYVHAVAAAVGRAVIEGDDSETLAQALGTALAQPPWPLEPPFLGSDAKVWSASDAIGTGLAALESARAGLTGRPDLVEADDGFLEEFADAPLAEFLEGLGERWHTSALTVKAVPGCAYVTAPIEAALDVRREFDRGRTTIDRVDVYGSLFTTEVDDRASRYLEGPDSPTAALSFTVPYNVAAALVDGEHTPRQVGARAADREVWRLADRVTVHHDPTYTVAALRSEVPLGAMLRRVGPRVVGYAAKTLGPVATLRHLPTLLRFARKRPLPDDLARAEKRVGARVEVTTADGRRFESTVERPSGFAGNPPAEIRAVARRKCWRALEAAGVRRATATARSDELLSLGEADRVDLGSLLEQRVSA